MPLDAAKANAKIVAINDAFAAIGMAGETKMPRSTHASVHAGKSNREPFAWEYHVASHLARIAEARKKRAHAAAVKAGLMFDHEKQPMPTGTSTLVYAGDVVEIAVAVTTAATRLDAAALVEDLEKNGVARKLLDKLTAKHTSENRAPHKFTSSLVTT